MKELWEAIKAGVTSFLNGAGLKIVQALAIFVLGILIIAVVKKGVKKRAMRSRKVDNSAAAFVTSLVAVVAYVFLALLLIGSLGFSTTGIIAAFSSVMLAISLGLQDTLSSLTNGILLIFTKPFVAGDFVDIGGTSGTIKEIKLFSVKIMTTDNLTVVIPNNQVLTSVIINYSKMPIRRMEIVVPVTYEADVDKVKAVVKEVVEKDERIKKNPSYFFRLTEYGASSLNFTLRVWTDVGSYWDVRFDLMERILQALRENEIEIPFDQLDVHVKTEKEA